MGPAPAPNSPGICEAKAELECSYKEAETAFNTARAAIRQKVGASSKAEFMTLDRGADLAWDRLQQARKELATHIREHGCGIIPDAPASHKPIW